MIKELLKVTYAKTLKTIIMTCLVLVGTITVNNKIIAGVDEHKNYKGEF